MKKILVAAAVAMVACVSSNANAQCIGCQQNAQPVFSSAPVQTYSAPVQSFAPVQSYGVPVQSYAPIQSYSAPVQSYGVPVQSFAPVQSYGIPVQSYSAPIQSYPIQGCGCSGSTIGQPIYGGTITSGTIMNHGVVEGSIVNSEAMVDAPVEATPAAPVADSMEPPVPPVSTPGPEADGT